MTTTKPIDEKLNAYLSELEKYLQNISVTDRSDIILELSGHVRESLNDNTKTIDSILTGLGKPEHVAGRYLADRGVNIQPTKKTSWFKWGCFSVLGISLIVILCLVLLVKNLFPIIDVNEKEERVQILGGLIDVDGKKDSVKLLYGLFNVNDDITTTKNFAVSVIDDDLKSKSTDTRAAKTGAFKEYAAANFHAIKLAMNGTVRFMQSDSYSVRVEATPDRLSRITVTESQGMLIIDESSSSGIHISISPSDEPIIYVSAPSLDNINIIGSGDFLAQVLTTTQLGIAIDGSGDVKIDNLKTQDLTANVYGSGEIVLAGETHSLQVRIDGSGDFESKHLGVLDAVVVVMGSGDVYVNVKNTLNATVKGSGGIYYSGNPQVSTTIEGSGKIENTNNF